MDLSIPNKTTNVEESTLPVRDETEAPSVEGSCGKDASDSLDIRGETEPLYTRRPMVDHTVRPHTILSPNRAPSSVHTGVESNENNALPSTEEHCMDTPFPIPVTPPVGESMQSPENTTIDSCNSLTRRQIRRGNAKQRKRMSHHDSRSPVNKTECSNRKRTLAVSADSSQSSEVKRAKVTQAETSTERVAIIPVTFPAEQILQNHIAVIQETIITSLLDAPEPLPLILLGNLVGGALFANCIGRDSVNWLSETISQTRIAGLDMKVVDAKDLPKPVKMAWKTKIVGEHDIKLLLRVLQKYNPSLNTDQWKVLDTTLDSHSSRRIILMDRVSADVIRNAGYQLFSGVDMSTFKVLEDSEKGKSADCSTRDVLNDSI